MNKDPILKLHCDEMLVSAEHGGGVTTKPLSLSPTGFKYICNVVDTCNIGTLFKKIQVSREDRFHCPVNIPVKQITYNFTT